MIGLLQVVTYATVTVNDQIVGSIERGLLLFLGIQRDDSPAKADRLVERVLGYRIFPDQNNRMNCSVLQINGGVLVVPQFTLAADTKKGMRPSFTPAASPEIGEKLFNYFVGKMRIQCNNVAMGQFGAFMKVSLCNDGPVTFWLQ